MTAFPLIELIWIYIGIKLNELMKCSLQCLQQSSYSTFLYQHHNLHKFAWKWASNIDYQITHQNAFNHNPVETRPTNQYKEYQRNRLKNIHLKNIHQNFIKKIPTKTSTPTDLTLTSQWDLIKRDDWINLAFEIKCAVFSTKFLFCIVQSINDFFAMNRINCWSEMAAQLANAEPAMADKRAT